MRHRLAWIGHTRSDVLEPVNILSQVTEKTFGPHHVKLINGIIQRVKRNDTRGLIHHDLKLSHLRIIVYTDSSLENNNYATPKLGLLVLLTDNMGRANCLNYFSYNSKRVVRSVLDGKTYAFVYGFDSVFMLRHDVEKMVGFKFPLTMLTDSESLFRIIVRSSITT